MSESCFETPLWVSRILRGDRKLTPEEAMRLAIELAEMSVTKGSSPFGAVICDNEGVLIEAGWNSVWDLGDSTAHAEVNCIRRLQHKLCSVELANHQLAPFTLYSSGEPCIQCFGAIYWSGIKTVYASARKADIEAIGFDEGPTTEEMWQSAAAKKQIILIRDLLREEGLAPLKSYQAKGGRIY